MSTWAIIQDHNYYWLKFTHNFPTAAINIALQNTTYNANEDYPSIPVCAQVIAGIIEEGEVFTALLETTPHNASTGISLIISHYTNLNLININLLLSWLWRAQPTSNHNILKHSTSAVRGHRNSWWQHHWAHRGLFSSFENKWPSSYHQQFQCC